MFTVILIVSVLGMFLSVWKSGCFSVGTYLFNDTLASSYVNGRVTVSNEA